MTVWGDATVPAWARRCGMLAIVASLPTIVWRVVVGCGLHLGTPARWRHDQSIPGSGTVYVCGLSAVQLAVTLLTLVLVRPRADRVPAWSPVRPGSRWPARLVVGTALAGAAALAVICVLSAINWDKVDPFAHSATVSGWAVLCWLCYGLALCWPVLLAVAAVGYGQSRRA